MKTSRVMVPVVTVSDLRKVLKRFHSDALVFGDVAVDEFDYNANEMVTHCLSVSDRNDLLDLEDAIRDLKMTDEELSKVLGEEEEPSSN